MSDRADLFDEVVESISEIGVDWHTQTILTRATENARVIDKTIRDLPTLESAKRSRAVVVSAGPSLHRTNALDTLAKSDFDGAIVAIDGSYIKCLQAGVVPDYVLTLDPHHSRIVRWFGDPDFETNVANDDYFSRQDLNVDFREQSIVRNQENIRLVDEYAAQTKLIMACTAPANVVERASNAGFDTYWWMPLVDDPDQAESLTSQMREITRLPAFNTGGNVGTAAWVFARCWLGIEQTAVLGMDLGYPPGTPYQQTQTYYELRERFGEAFSPKNCFPVIPSPATDEPWFTDPTYYWYRKNLLDLLSSNQIELINCTEGGTLHGPYVKLVQLKHFLG